MKVYKVELMIIDLDEIGEQEIKNTLEHTHYPNYCIAPKVKGIESKDIGKWTDDHPLNKLATAEDEYNRLFPKNTDL